MIDRPAKPAGSHWTDEQWQAITERGSHVLVAAAAGSGKTAVLVERILRIITDERKPVDVDRLLVATFTKAAADEMRQRMRQALEAKLAEGDASPHLRRQLALIHRASFTTLHSFCMDVITRYYARIPLDPGFRVANGTEAELIRQDALETLFETLYEESPADSPFWGLVERYGGRRGDEGLYALVLQLYDYSRSHPFPDAWLRASAAAFGTFGGEGDHPLVRQLLSDAAFALEGALAELAEALDGCRRPGGPAVYAETIGAEAAAVRRMLDMARRGAWEELRGMLHAGTFGRLKAARGEALDRDLLERVKAQRDRAKKRLADLAGGLFSRPLADFAEEMRQAAPFMNELAELVIRFDRTYGQMKKAKRLLDFSDLEHFALRVLCAGTDADGRLIPTEAALEYREQYEEILIDEFQDTNRVQEAILSLISRPQPGNRFMVGDVKQSIYRFRLAEPGIFLAKYKAYRADGPAGGAVTGAETGIAIDLSRNFRSRREVVEAVNYVFGQVMDGQAAEIEYDRQAELVYGAGYPDSPDGPEAMAAELHLIHRNEEEAAASGVLAEAEDTAGGLDELYEMETAELEARFAAARIRELTGMEGKPALKVWDRALGAHRDCEFRDIVILLRATSAWAPVFVEQLGLLGVPAHAELSGGYFDAVEVDMMLSLLKVIDNPLQDIPLAGVLRSPLVGLSAEQLAQIRLADRKGTYYEAMLAFLEHAPAGGKGPGLDDLRGGVENGMESGAPESGNSSAASIGQTDGGKRDDSGQSADAAQDQTRQTVAAFLGRLREWRREAARGALSDLIWRIYRETGFYDYMGGLPGGTVRQANLRALYDRARQFEATSLRGLFRFLRFIERMREAGGDLGAAGTAGEQDNVVRIMSIHKSKGLEFPVVIVSGMAKTFNERDLHGEFLLHRELGFGPLIVDPARSVSHPSIAHAAISRRLRMEMAAEEMRILYVALTRAKEKLIMTATTRNIGKLVESWSHAVYAEGRKLPAGAIASARSFLDWVGPAILRHPLLADFRRAWHLPASGPFELPDSARFVVRVVPQSRLAAWREAAAGMKGNREWLAKAAAGEPLPAPAIRLILPVGAGNAALPAEPAADWLGWTYPHEAAGRRHAKTTVTEIKRQWEWHLAETEETPPGEIGYPAAEGERATSAETLSVPAAPAKPGGAFSRRPRFLTGRTVTGAERGTAFHAVMQHIPLEEPVDETAVRQTISRLAAMDIVPASQADSIDPGAIARFFRTDLGMRLLRSGKVEREVPFSYALPAGDVYREAADDLAAETVLIQGVIDCLFAENDGLVLVDFKSDRVYGDPLKAAEKYRIQLELYARAVEAIRKRPVKQAALYFFDGGHTVVL